VRDLAGIEPLHLEEIDEERTVFVDGLGAVGGETPVGGQGWFVASWIAVFEPKKGELGIGVADIESK
jgi:hypothetical protein